MKHLAVIIGYPGIYQPGLILRYQFLFSIRIFGQISVIATSGYSNKRISDNIEYPAPLYKLSFVPKSGFANGMLRNLADTLKEDNRNVARYVVLWFGSSFFGRSYLHQCLFLIHYIDKLLLAGPVCALPLHHQEVHRDADRQAVHRANPELYRRIFLRCLERLFLPSLTLRGVYTVYS